MTGHSNERSIWRRFAVAIALAGCVSTIAVTRPAIGASDALQRKVLGELKGFTDWLVDNGAGGFIGEVGWPNGYLYDEKVGASAFKEGESEKWNALADQWYNAADAAKLWVTAFSAGESMGADEWLRIYGSKGTNFESPPPLDTVDRSAVVVEKHLTTGDYQRGVHDFGGARCHSYANEQGGLKKRSYFSNHTPYVYEDSGKHSAKFGENSCYHFDSAESLAFLASRGVKLARLDFRWERIQQDVGGDLRTEDVQHIVDWVRAAEAVGITPVIDLHNYGHLFIWNKRAKRGIQTPIGSKKLPIEAFADVWRRLSDVFKSDPNVVYDLMNEPQSLDTATTPGAKIWEQASQAAVDAIRANGDNNLILVEGYDFAAVERWAEIHPTGWITDPAKNFRYEGHHYFDRNSSGYYSHTYDEEVADAAEKGF